MSGGGGQIKGYWYSLGIHMGICRGPVNEIVETRVGDKPILGFYLPITDSGVIPMFNPGLFGGTDGEGGIAGPMTVMMGKDDQVCPFPLQLMNFPTPQPGFRRICSVFYDGLVSAINPYPKPWTFRVRRTTKGWDGDPWYPEKAMIELTRPWAISEITSTPIIHAMNPAHIFYEVMTNREWGRGLPRAALDDANLRAVADTLYAEGFGLCFYWARSDSIETFVQSILDHIGAVLRPNPTTGELQLKLLRKDYVVDDLPLFDNESGLLDITEASVAAMPTIINHVKVTFKDPITGKDGSVGTHNLAGVQGSNGEINTLAKDYPGIPTPDLAARVALRDLRASSNALRRFTVTLDRRGQNVQPGDVIRVRDFTRGIGEVIVRIGKYEEGNNLDGRISLTAVQDIFRMTPGSYVGNQPPTWEAPNTSPCIGFNRTFEMPYFMLAHTMSTADLNFVGEDSGYIGQVVELGARPLNAGYKIAVRNGMPTEDDIPDADTNYCPTVPTGWDGGDCVKIIMSGGETFTMVMTCGEDSTGMLEHTRGYSRNPPNAVAFGSIVGERADRVTQINLQELSESFPDPAMGFVMLGNADDGYSVATLTIDGAEHDIALTYVEGGIEGYDGSWQGFTPMTGIAYPDIGENIVVRVSTPNTTRGYFACCTCLEIDITGTPTLTPEVDPYVYACNGTVVLPSGLSMVDPLYPLWGPAWIDYTTDPDSFSDNSLVFVFSPIDHPYLTSAFNCKVYDDSDGGVLAYETTLYLAGNSEALGFAIYFERPIVDITTTPYDAYPVIYSGTPPVNPAAALAGHNLRFVLTTANECCGGLPDLGEPRVRVSGVNDADSAVWINTGVVDVTAGSNGVWNSTFNRVALPGFNSNRVFEVAVFGSDGEPLAEEDQPTWTISASNGDSLCMSNAAVSNPHGVAGGFVFNFGGGTAFNRTVTLVSSRGQVITIAVHYPEAEYTQTCTSTRTDAPGIGDRWDSASGTGSAVFDYTGALVSNSMSFTATGTNKRMGPDYYFTIFNAVYFGMSVTATFKPSGVSWINDSEVFDIYASGDPAINYQSTVYCDWDTDGIPTPGPAAAFVTTSDAGPLNTTRWVNFVGKDVGGGSPQNIGSMLADITNFKCTPIGIPV